jgi:adenosine deaminase
MPSYRRCVCPLSNWRLKVYDRFCGGKNPLKRMLDAGLTVSLSSDDPAFFGGYIHDNYARAAADCGLGKPELWQLAFNSVHMVRIVAGDSRPDSNFLSTCAGLL